MADPDTPVLEAELNPATDPIRYVEWVHFGDPGWRPAQPPAGMVAVAFVLYFDGVKVGRGRGEVNYPNADDPWWLASAQYRHLMGLWSAAGGQTEGTRVTFWVGSQDVEIVEEDVARLRVRVCGRDLLTPLGAPVPAPSADPRIPVQVTMFVNRFTVGPLLDDSGREVAP